MKLTPGGRTALWIGGGGFIGLAIGALLVSPSSAADLAPVWLIGLAVFAGIVIGVARDKSGAPSEGRKSSKAAPAAAPARPSLAPHAPDALAVRFEFPDVPDGYPIVLGRGEPLHVTVKVLQAAQPSEGAGVQLTATMGADSGGRSFREDASQRVGTLTGDGVTGTSGEVEFTIEPEGTGELQLAAEAKSGAHAGRGGATVSIVEYDVEIDRLFGEFRAYAVGVLGGDAQADTARELCDKLRVRSDPSTARALLELARIYELVAYGERVADRRLYLSLLEQLVVLEHAELPDSHLARSA